MTAIRYLFTVLIFATASSLAAAEVRHCAPVVSADVLNQQDSGEPSEEEKLEKELEEEPECE